MKIEIRDSIPEDIDELIPVLRAEEIHEAEILSVDPRKSLELALRVGIYKKTIVIGGRVSAMWGCGGDLLGNGQVYFLTGYPILQISPLKFFRLYKKEVSVMRRLFYQMGNYVDSSYTGAVRMLKMSGFTVEEGFPLATFRIDGMV